LEIAGNCVSVRLRSLLGSELLSHLGPMELVPVVHFPNPNIHGASHFIDNFIDNVQTDDTAVYLTP